VTVEEFPQRIADKIQVTGFCWLWTGATDRGYPRVAYPLGVERSARAHRVVYELLVGKIPKGKYLDHLCRVRRCVNPDHLEPVTARENTLRSPISPAALNSLKTHCPRGHEYAGDNLGVYRQGSRYCRACKRVKDRDWHRRRAGRRAQLS
jgi:hypothetical protein